MSDRESVLAALFAAVSSVLMVPATSAAVKSKRNEAVPSAIPDGGLVLMYDGDPGEPEVTFSPLTYHYEHRAELVIAVQLATGQDAAFDALCGAIADVIEADRTLGGRCDWVEPMAPAPEPLPFEGGTSAKVVRVPVILHYATVSPLG